MKIRGFITAVAILAALTGGLYWSGHHKPAETTAPTDVSPKILTLKESDIDSITIKKKDVGEILLKKTGGDWRITSPLSFAADQSAVSGIVTAVANLDAQRLVETNSGDLSQFGLASPTLTITVGENKKTHQLLLGDATPTGNGVYAKLADDPRLFTIASFNQSSLDKTLNDLRDRRMITLPADQIKRIEIDKKRQMITFERDKTQWQIVKPKPMRADSSKVDGLVSALSDAKLDLSSGDDPKKAASAFAAGTPVASLKVTTDSDTQALEVRKAKDDYYAKTSVADGIYKISGDLGPQLDKKVDDFRNKKLFSFGFGEPDKIEIHDRSKAYFFTHSGNDWWSADGKKLEPDGVDQLTAKLRDLEAGSFADSGFSAPALDITITSNGGKQIEQVRISKGRGGNYIAERQNDPTLYVLDAAVVAELQKLAAGVKPAEPPKK